MVPAPNPHPQLGKTKCHDANKTSKTKHSGWFPCILKKNDKIRWKIQYKRTYILKTMYLKNIYIPRRCNHVATNHLVGVACPSCTFFDAEINETTHVLPWLISEWFFVWYFHDFYRFGLATRTPFLITFSSLFRRGCFWKLLDSFWIPLLHLACFRSIWASKAFPFGFESVKHQQTTADTRRRTNSSCLGPGKNLALGNFDKTIRIMTTN